MIGSNKTKYWNLPIGNILKYVLKNLEHSTQLLKVPFFFIPPPTDQWPWPSLSCSTHVFYTTI